jgi:tetratricopeptide (TPR) repeat protein
MRTHFLALSLCFAAAVSAIAQQNAAQTPPAAPAYQEAVREAMTGFVQRDFATALAGADKADAVQPGTPLISNLRGAVAIEQRRFEDGRKYCLQALEKDPKFFPARFNLAEIPFVQKKFAEAREEFLKLQTDHPKDDLLRFRIYLTYLLEGNMEKSRELLDAVPFLSDTPIYYYSHAAWEYSRGNEAEGRRWVNSGSSVFSPQKISNFADVFFDLGWLKREAPAGKSAAQ